MNSNKPTANRAKAYKRMSLDELIKEKGKAIAIIQQLRQLAIDTLLDIDGLMRQLNIPIESPPNLPPSSLGFPSSLLTSPAPPSNNPIEREDFSIQFTHQSEAGEVNISLINPEDSLDFRQFSE